MQEEMIAPDIGQLSPRLRRVIEDLRADSCSLSSRMLGVLRSAVPEYRSLDDTLAQDVYRVGVKNAQLWYDALLTGEKPCDDDLRWVGQFSQRRHAQDVSLAALLQAYRIGTRIYMDALLGHVGGHVGQKRALSGEVLFRVSPFLLYYSDLLGRTVSDAYLADRTRELRWRERLHAELHAAVFNAAQQQTVSFDDTARALGIDVARPHMALALRLAVSQGAADVDLPMEMAEQWAQADHDAETPASATLHRGHLLLWLPVASDETADARERRAIERARRLLNKCPDADAVGLGLPASGVAGWRSSAEQAMAAIDLRRRMGGELQVSRYSEFALDVVLKQSSEMSSLCEEMLGRIASEASLLDTLAAYFEHRQNHKAVAAALGIHRNTLVHRLARIEALLGARFDDMAWLSRLYLALRQRQLVRGAASSH